MAHPGKEQFQQDATNAALDPKLLELAGIKKEWILFCNSGNENLQKLLI
jgi:hypothetical protein